MCSTDLTTSTFSKWNETAKSSSATSKVWTENNAGGAADTDMKAVGQIAAKWEQSNEPPKAVEQPGGEWNSGETVKWGEGGGSASATTAAAPADVALWNETVGQASAEVNKWPSEAATVTNAVSPAAAPAAATAAAETAIKAAETAETAINQVVSR